VIEFQQLFLSISHVNMLFIFSFNAVAGARKFPSFHLTF
jgi:hypothetical protein